ncbi:MAG TPA: hypothetical protein DCE78_01400 [Bacteroidetes bacterium]|nr:hypothetical protein [Bacteroidota bacterium]
MKSRVAQVVIGLGIAAVFVALSLRQVNVADVATELRSISLWWIIPYFFVVLLSHLARAERWKLLLDDEADMKNSRMVMMSAIMYGYITNIVVPRAGEVFRAVYAGRHSGIQSTKLFGTIILERIIDVFMMLVMLLITFMIIVRDPNVLNQIFGTDGAFYIQQLTSATGLSIIALGLILTLSILWYLRNKHQTQSGSDEVELTPDHEIHPIGFKNKLSGWIKNFFRGVISIRKLKNWPLFVVYTLAIWMCYILTSLLPFYAFGVFSGFGLEEAFVITVVGAVGVALPSPGGIGTYHYMVQTGLVVLYSISPITALSYATIGHFINIMCLIVISIVLFLMNTLYQKRNPA